MARVEEWGKVEGMHRLVPGKRQPAEAQGMTVLCSARFSGPHKSWGMRDTDESYSSSESSITALRLWGFCV
jgi:hypothetical protein